MDAAALTDQLIALEQARADARVHLRAVRPLRGLDQRWRKRADGDVDRLGSAVGKLAGAAGIELPAPAATAMPEEIDEAELSLMLADAPDADREKLVAPDPETLDDELAPFAAQVVGATMKARDQIHLVVNYSASQARHGKR